MASNARLVGLVCAAALATACTSGEATPDASPTTSATASDVAASEASPSPSQDPFAMPDPVTEEYVDRVVNTIYEEWGAITRELLEQPADPTAVTPIETRERIEELFGGESLLNRFEEADAAIRGPREGFLPPSEFLAVKWATRQIYRANDECLVVAGDFDTSGTSEDGGPVLSAMSLEASPVSDGNPTGWRVIDGFTNTGAGGETFDDSVMLEASISDFGDLLTTSCAGQQ